MGDISQYYENVDSQMWPYSHLDYNDKCDIRQAGLVELVRLHRNSQKALSENIPDLTRKIKAAMIAEWRFLTQPKVQFDESYHGETEDNLYNFFLKNAVSKMPEELQKIYTLYTTGETQESIGKLLNTTHQNVSLKIEQIRKHLRKHLT